VLLRVPPEAPDPRRGGRGTLLDFPVIPMGGRGRHQGLLESTCIFLTLNSAVFTTIGVFWTTRVHVASWLLIFPVLVLLGQCLAWFWRVRSYRQLNAAKYAVVGALEERLPASPCWRAEWKALGEGKDPSRYWPLTHLEQWIPAFLRPATLVGYTSTARLSRPVNLAARRSPTMSNSNLSNIGQQAGRFFRAAVASPGNQPWIEALLGCRQNVGCSRAVCAGDFRLTAGFLCYRVP
jgi:hypothetical protein